MNKIKHGHKSPKFLSFLMLLIFSVFPLAACSQKVDSDMPISPAVNLIAEQNQMAKSALKGEDIEFSISDFARAANVARIEKITITSLPPVSDGCLSVGSAVLSSTQTLSAASVDLLTYSAASDISSSEFKFKINDSPYEMSCKLYMLDKENYAPTLSVASQNALEVSTYKNVSLYGNLPSYDPDGDQTYIEIVSYPEKGILTLTDVCAGTYKYTPYEDSKGKDSFVYVAKDKYGNYSASATVSLQIESRTTDVVYVDLENSPYHNSAIAMTECGIMSGTRVGGSTFFYPDATVSRAEFTVMAMNAAGIREVNSASTTVFSDDADIPSNLKGYIAAAYELGYIKGIELDDGRLCFEGQRAISRAEAAVMLANMLDAATPTFTPVFADSEEIPVWAAASVSSMNNMGILNIEEGNNISPTASVTRGDAANILSKFMSVKENN